VAETRVVVATPYSSLHCTYTCYDRTHYVYLSYLQIHTKEFALMEFGITDRIPYCLRYSELCILDFKFGFITSTSLTPLYYTASKQVTRQPLARLQPEPPLILTLININIYIYINVYIYNYIYIYIWILSYCMCMYISAVSSAWGEAKVQVQWNKAETNIPKNP